MKQCASVHSLMSKGKAVLSNVYFVFLEVKLIKFETKLLANKTVLISFGHSEKEYVIAFCLFEWTPP